MKYDGSLDIALGYNVKTTIWRNETHQWSSLVERLSTEHKTKETIKYFLKASKNEQTEIKDVGGYVGGYLRKGRRKPANVAHRQLLTLDIDFAKPDFWENFCLSYDNAAFLHSTHKHTSENPRLRLVMPLSREVAADEYEALARRLAGDLGIELFDNTTFQVHRLMFWPSTPIDVAYYYEYQDGPWLDADELLSSYPDWKDSSLWPSTNKGYDEIKGKVAKQIDPESKTGVIGAFCRAYPIEQALETFLKGDYAPTGIENRYTYLKGSTSGGLITYEGKFTYSHHGTDPTSGKLCNAFDLVRIHRFGHLDNGDTGELKRRKSFKEMEAFALQDKQVKKLIAEETISTSKYYFEEEDKQAIEKITDLEWTEDLEVDGRGIYKSSATNINLILANDEGLKGRFKQNEFNSKNYIVKSCPWRKIKKPEPMRNVDYSGVRNYIESTYGITGNLKIDDSLALTMDKCSFHPIKEYLSSVKWDGVERVDNLLIDYFGADDNLYSRESIRKMLVGAVARIFQPGIKFDLVLTLVSEEGTGKSTFVNKLGMDWFSDTFFTVTGKEALEQIQGAWIIEMAELAGLRKAEIESVKHFITKQEDSFRPAYGRVSETYKRQCVFFGTTNDKTFLKEPSGNRRFMPIDVNRKAATKDIFSKSFDSEIGLIWAEAVHLYKKGEKLFLSKEADKLASAERKQHIETDERAGMIEKYLDKKITLDWDQKNIYERRGFYEEDQPDSGVVERLFVCIAEIWCECLGKERHDMDRYKTREINNILKNFEGWEQSKSTRNFKIYGKQKYYRRVE